MRRQSGTTSAKAHNLQHYTQDLLHTSQRGTDCVTSCLRTEQCIGNNELTLKGDVVVSGSTLVTAGKLVAIE